MALLDQAVMMIGNEMDSAVQGFDKILTDPQERTKMSTLGEGHIVTTPATSPNNAYCQRALELLDENVMTDVELNRVL
jgi:hypothetical protein